MFAEFLKKDEFYKKYMQLYAMRQAIGNLEMEDSKTEILYPNRTQEMFNNLNAFDNILAANPEKISPYDLIDIADDVNKNVGFYDKGFRRTQVEVVRAQNFFPPAGKDVAPAIYSLFNGYHKIWFDMPVYEKEAKFHIELVRIQPFEDGNKRTARILTNYNLCKQNRAPVVINGLDTDEYFGYIDNYDVDGFANFLKDKSNEEFKIMINLYRNIVGDSFELDDPIAELKDGDVRIYEVARKMILDMDKIPNEEDKPLIKKLINENEKR